MRHDFNNMSVIPISFFLPNILSFPFILECICLGTLHTVGGAVLQTSPPLSVWALIVGENREEKIHVHVQPGLIDCSLAMKQFSVPIMSLQMTEAT